MVLSIKNSRHFRESGNPAASDSERMSHKPIGLNCFQLFGIHTSRRRGTLDSRLRGNDAFVFVAVLQIMNRF